ncbi:MAG: PAS domain-containing sensor histidine kinase [Anaerolineae bacterium]
MFQLFLSLIVLGALVYVIHALFVTERTDPVYATIGIFSVAGLLIASVLMTRTAFVLTRYSQRLAEHNTQVIDALRLSEQNMRTMLDNSNIAFMLLDREYRMIAWNAHAVELWSQVYGRPLEQNTCVLDYMTPPARDDARQSYVAVLEGESQFGDMQMTDIATGKPHYLHWSRNPVYDAQGQIVGICSVTQDITPQKELEAYAREQELVFHELVQHTNIAFWIYSVTEKRYLYVSPYYETLFEITPEELIANPNAYKRSIHPDDVEVRAAAARRAYIENVPYNVRYRHILKDGSIRWLWARSYAIPSPDGTRIRDIGLAEDITPLVEARERMHEQDMIFREITEHSNMTFWVRDLLRDGKYIYFSPSYESIFHHSAAEQDTDRFAYRRRIHPDDLPAEIEMTRRYQEEGVPYEIRYRIVLDDGSIRWLWSRVAKIYNDKGIATRSLGYAEDITALKDLEERAVELALERERHALLTSFIQSVSHEFRTPLATIHTGLHLLRTTEDKDRRVDRIDRIEEQANRIMRLVEDMVTLTRLENDASLMKETIDITPLLTHSVEYFQKQAAAKSIDLSGDISPNLPMMRAAPEELMRALRYLLSNAIRYTPPEGHVKLKACVEGDQLRIDIEDSGVGMDEETLRRAFEQFYRGDSAQSTNGAGLGLPVARRVVELHGGTLTAISSPEKGSTFTIHIPLKSKTAPLRSDLR